MKIRELSVEERIRLVEDIRDSIAADRTSAPVPPGHLEELNRRLEAYRVDQAPGRPAREVIESIRKAL